MGFAHTQSNLKQTLLPLLMVIVVAMIIFPLPYWMLDILLAANIAFCIILLLSSLFITEPDRFTSLPSLLLLSTLFRLGLNISSTRLILSGVKVPDVIIAFGNFVVSGSTIVGLVVFSIISIIQFVVIAKGSERVAEVAARFTLDALPGKQMSIDADMRAGLLSLSEAREKRRELHRESKLYGALDGAMKFIKGDAIVGLCIIIVNIVAGFIVGVTRDGLSFSDAVVQYTLFTIGDGLVSQLPAVLVSVAAGIVVTRVSEHEGGMLSEEIGGQLCREPKVLFISSIVLFILGLVPGLPFVPFLGISLMIMLVWLKLKNKTTKTSIEKKVEYQFSPKILPPVVLTLSPQGAMLLQKEETISSYIEAIRSEIFDLMGVLLPDVAFDIDPNKTTVSAELFIYSQSKGMVLFDLLNYNQDSQEKSIENDSERIENIERDPWSRLVGRLLKTQTENLIHEFVDDAHTRRLLDLYESYHLDLINLLLPEKMNITFLTLVLRELVNEKISIRDFSGILQALSEHFYYQENLINKDNLTAPLDLAVLSVRKKLIPKLIQQTHSKDSPIEVLILGEEIEEKILSHCEADIKIHPELIDFLVKCLNKEFDQRNIKKLILLVHPLIRAPLKKINSLFDGKLQIFSFDEIPSAYGISIKCKLGEIGETEKDSIGEELYENAA